MQDYPPLDPALVPSGFSDTRAQHVNECIARIESIKIRIMGNHYLDDFEKADFLRELDILRAAYLHMTTLAPSLGLPDGGTSEPGRPAGSGHPAQLELEGILGQHPQIVSNLEKIARIAPSKLTVLLEGETGSGKELFARIIHLNSRRQKFVAVNCGAFPQGVIESELFGHVKGSFTGATSDRKGRFEEADQGTIFLDEIGDLELQAQVKLLRVLDVGEIQRVGSDRIISVDVRIIAATNRNLQEMVRIGTFREDLLYRLNMVPLQIPPLRDRRDELELLLEFFLKKFARETDLPVPELTDPLRRFLLHSYDYPGNIRELRNLALYLVHINTGTPLGPDNLPDRYRQKMSGDGTPAPAPGRTLIRDSAERDYLLGVMRKHRGNVKLASQDLDLSRSRVYQMLKKHGLRPESFRDGASG